MTIWAIVPAAGIGSRMAPSESEPAPKQYRPLLGKAVLSHSLGKLLGVPEINRIIVALNKEDRFWQELPEATNPRVKTVAGGRERQHSVLNALQALVEAQADDWVLVHDAVRPCVAIADIRTLITELSTHTCGGLLGSPVDNTLKKIDADHQVVQTVDRDLLCNALTPQMFRYSVLLQALQQALEGGVAVTDEASAVELAGGQPKLVPGSKYNIKITHEEDLAVAALLLSKEGEEDHG